MATNEVTRNWGAIQVKSIDPYADVASDITSRLTKLIGSDNAYIKGFDLIRYYTDLDYNGIIVQIDPGIGIVSNILIEITESTTVKLASFPIPFMDDYAIVLEYIYQKINPPPTAVIKGIRAIEIDSRIHLPLYLFKLNGWSSFVNNDIFMNWMLSSKEYLMDERHRTGYIHRSGGTVYGVLKLNRISNKEIEDDELVTKKYVDDTLNDALGIIDGELNGNTGLFGRYVKKAGDTMVGPLYLHEEVPVVENQQLATKKYIDDTSLCKYGDTMLGKLLLKNNPIEPMQAATKEYVDKSAIEAANNMQVTMNHGDLRQLGELYDHHTLYIRRDGLRAFTSPIQGVTPIVDAHLTTKKYVDDQYRSMNTRIDNLVLASGTGWSVNPTKHSLLSDLNSDDHKQYVRVDGNRDEVGFTNVINGIYPISPNNLSTKEYVDDKVEEAKNIFSRQFTTIETLINNLDGISNNNTNFTLDHSQLTGILLDGAHPQYVLRDGSNARFVFPISVGDAVSNEDAVNKSFMENYVHYTLTSYKNDTIIPEVNNMITTGLSSINIPTYNLAPINNRIDSIDNNISAMQSQINSIINNSNNNNNGNTSITDHNQLLNRDDPNAHMQYVLVDGSRSITNPIRIADPTLNDHAVTLGYMKDYITNNMPATIDPNKVMLNDGSVSFNMPVEGIAGTTNNSLVTYAQLTQATRDNDDHNQLRNIYDDDAHPQYLLRSGDSLIGKLHIQDPVDNDEPVTYYMYKQLLKVFEKCHWNLVDNP